MKTRQSGLDLLRCLGLLLVNGVHSYLYNGFYYESQTGLLMWGANSVFWLFYTCNGLFMTLTGYLKCDKPLSRSYYRSLLPILVGYLLTCVISFPIRHFLLDEKLTLYQWLEKLVTFGNYAWYIEMYIGLLLFSPVINMVLEKLTEPKQLYWLAGTMVVMTALPSIAPVSFIPDYWKAMYPVTYYVLGAVIKKLQPQIKPWLCLLGAAATAMWMAFMTLISTDGNFSDGFGQGYGGFWVTMIIVFVFLGLYRLDIRPRTAKVLSWLSGGVFEGYILSRLLDVWIYAAVPQWHKPAMYPMIFLCVTIPVFIISILAGKGVHTLALKLTASRQKKAPAHT